MHCALLPILLAACVSAAPRRDVLFLFEDDGGFASSVYGDLVIPTPSLDSLAARGTVFDEFSTSVSSCSPSRASLLTGIPTHQSGQWGLLNSHFYSYQGVRSLPNVLTEAGVATGIIGKFHVATAGGPPTQFYNFSWGNSPTGPGGCEAGASDSCPNTDYNLVSRNISHIHQAAASFFDWAQNSPSFLYIAFGDSHRCGGAVGEFCENYGRDASGASTIPGWTPFVTKPSSVQLPFWIQDTPIARSDYANMYTAKNRMDQGIGMVLEELKAAGRADSTLVIYTSDNGAPFAAGKTNFYSPGIGEPLIISMPGGAVGARTSILASQLDLAPTIYDWLGVMPPEYRLNGAPVRLQGRSLLPFLSGPPAPPRTAPHIQWHEEQMYYPMRVVIASDVTSSFRYKLIYNIARGGYPVASDLYAAPSFQDLLNRTAHNEPTHWYRNFTEYLAPRPQWQLFDLIADPQEAEDLATEGAWAGVLAALQTDIKAWQTATSDDWLIKWVHE